MSKIQGTACTAGTYIHHAFAALQYGQWHEAEALMRKASRLIEGEVEEAPDPRFVLLSACVGFEFTGDSFRELYAAIVPVVGRVDPFLLGQLIALVAQLGESASESVEWVMFLNEEIDNTLGELLTAKAGA